MSTNAITAQTLIQNPLVDSDGLPTKLMQDWAMKVDSELPSYGPLDVMDFGAAGNGRKDDTAALQKAINQAVKNGGATILLPPGFYMLGSVTFPKGSAPITLLGQGDATVLKRNADLPAGAGMLDIFGSNVTIDSLLIDGAVTEPAGLYYNQDFMGAGGNDPMAAKLTANTSLWLHGGANNFTFRRSTLQHTGGYAILLDAGRDQIADIRIMDSDFLNNRPHLFGVKNGSPSDQPIFGSWTGGIFANGDGTGTYAGAVVKRLLVSGCRFRRNAGNCLWSHVYGLKELHEGFQFLGNYFLDCGLDGILIGGVTGGCVGGNVFRRVGYVTVNDTDKSIPRWLVYVNATALDSSGIVKGVPFVDNSFLSINGGCMDLDSHGLSAISGNVARCPYPDEPEYLEDDIAHCGPDNKGQQSYGVNMGNSQKQAQGAAGVSITGNTLINLKAGLIRLFGARRCAVEANVLIASDDSLYPPIDMGPLGPEDARRCKDNRIAHNKCHYSPAKPGSPFVAEDGQYGDFKADEVNDVFGNNRITGNGNAIEFAKDVNSGSLHYPETVWFRSAGIDGGAF